MKDRLRRYWGTRSPRERVVCIALAAVLGTTLYVWLVQSAGDARLQLRASVETLRAQSAQLDRQALEYGRLRAAPAPTVSPTDLLALVQGRVDEAGLAGALVSIDAPAADQVVVAFGALGFADWLNWLAGLEAQQVRLAACRVEALSRPGLVSVTATLVRGGSR